LSEWRATLIARESACLDVEDRRRLDAELCANVSRLEGMGDARIVAAAKEIAARLDAQAVVDRAAKAEADRTVTIRPAPDCMTYVTALLPVAQGVGVYAALNKTVGIPGGTKRAIAMPRILGLDLIADPNVAEVSGTSPVYVYRADDFMWFDSGPQAQVHYDAYATSLGVLLSLWSYSGLISRYPSSIVRISGFAYGS
jgi:hypothetical protein